MIKNIVFDMGNVLLSFDPHVFIESVGVTNKEDRELLYYEIYHSSEWVSMDRGTLSLEEAEAIFRSRLPQHLHHYIDILITEWDRPILPVSGMCQLLQELKAAGYRLYLLSNASCHQPDYWSRVPGSDYFDGKLVSYEVGFLKPEQEIYRIFCERFSLKPEECLFIDDNPGNIEGASVFGMPGIVFHGNVRNLRRKLSEKGILLPSSDKNKYN